MSENRGVTKRAKSGSKQSRFDTPDSNDFFNAFMNFSMIDEFRDQEASEYRLDSRRRDSWLRKIVKKEPFMLGVLESATLIDANRGWEYIGGRNQVNRYVNITHSFWGAPGYQGYRSFMRMQSMAFKTSDLGSVSEIARDIVVNENRRAMLADGDINQQTKDLIKRQIAEEGAVRTLFYVDPAQCVLSGDPDYPMSFYPKKGRKQKWNNADFFRVVSSPSTDSSLNALGFCPVSRCLEMFKIAIGVMIHDQEEVRAKLPEALLLLQGISQEQWDNVIKQRAKGLSNAGYQYFGDLFTLASMREMQAQLFKFSSIPEALDRKLFTDTLMFLYALNFGYDPSEFWPVQFGSIGRGEETKIQQRQATSKGGMDFISSWSEQWSLLLPKTLHFEFLERDVEGEIQDADLANKNIQNVTSLYTSTNPEGESIITREEARSLLVTADVLPEDWTVEEEPSSASDEEMTARIFSNERIMRAAYQYPEEPIVRYSYPENKQRILFVSGEELISRIYYSIPRKNHQRQAELVDLDEILFQGDNFQITSMDVLQSIQEGVRRVTKELGEEEGAEYGNLLTAPIEE